MSDWTKLGEQDHDNGHSRDHGANRVGSMLLGKRKALADYRRGWDTAHLRSLRRTERDLSAASDDDIMQHVESVIQSGEYGGPVELPEPIEPEPDETPAIEILEPKQGGWALPPDSLITQPAECSSSSAGPDMGQAITDTLAAFKVGAKLIGSVRGPMVTRYELELEPGVKVSKVTALQPELAYSVASDRVRIIAPIPGRSAIGVEVPNTVRDMVLLSSVGAEGGPLSVPLGVGIDGETVSMNLARMPHLLVAGSTGSGKSAFINALLLSILMRATPDDVRLMLIDPKLVELTPYAGVPHLLTPIITDPDKASAALDWLVEHMEERYKLLQSAGVRNIDDYNRGSSDRMPYIVAIIDELADLMMVAGRTVERSIARIAQKARAVGIHLVIATQRPSVDVVTGLIKANVPSRVAFTVASHVDSRTVLDSGGAEHLTGMGDALFLPVGASYPVRFQGAYVDDDDIRRVVKYVSA